ncbi:unnamed protein product [Clonostachys byssicola]|uniref:Uncharacterized protein n=1 Tax=Clonostachys byssicola TaxID=160290 RepID=A0A9N9UHK6_9HYPO|nr:unnamed protein product [Clonostachys byssicola]
MLIIWEGSVIVNVGDFLMRCPASQTPKEIGFSRTADRKKVVQCVKELEGPGAQYLAVSAEEYLTMRRKATFKKV